MDLKYWESLLILSPMILAATVGLLIWLTSKIKDSFFYRKSKESWRQCKRDYKSRNELYICTDNDCKRMHRNYQAQLIEAVKGEGVCPHCLKNRSNGVWLGSYVELVTKEDKWMQSHIDCPAIGKREYHKIRQAIKTAEQLRKDEAAMKRFEEYNQFSVDVSWIKNLQKKELENGR